MPDAARRAVDTMRAGAPALGVDPDIFTKQVIVLAGWDRAADLPRAVLFEQQAVGDWAVHEVVAMMAHPDHPTLEARIVEMSRLDRVEPDTMVRLMRAQANLAPEEWPDLGHLDEIRAAGLPLGGGRATIVTITRTGMTIDSRHVITA